MENGRSRKKEGRCKVEVERGERINSWDGTVVVPHILLLISYSLRRNIIYSYLHTRSPSPPIHGNFAFLFGSHCAVARHQSHEKSVTGESRRNRTESGRSSIYIIPSKTLFQRDECSTGATLPANRSRIHPRAAPTASPIVPGAWRRTRGNRGLWCAPGPPAGPCICSGVSAECCLFLVGPLLPRHGLGAMVKVFAIATCQDRLLTFRR